MTPGIRVLCVDDDPDVRSLTATALERTSDELDVVTADCSREALDRVAAGDDLDCLVSDYDMPELDGLELFEAVRAEDPDLPFILFTGKGSEEIASEAISAGVTDYLQKGSGLDRYAVLANRIENAVDRRRTARARRESERELERYRTLVESMSDPMYVLDERGRCTVANEAFCDLVDADHERVLGTHISTFISRASLERGVKTVRRLHGSGRESGRFEVTVEGDDGKRRIGEANVTALTDDRGDRTGSTAVIRDITDRKRRERELSKYERIIELAPIALFILDAEATIVWCNDEFAAAYAEDIDELLGTQFPALVERGYYDERVIDKYTDEVRALLSSSADCERAKYQVQFRNTAGEERVHDVHTKLLPLEDGSFTGTIHAIRDITQRRRYQRELERQNDRLEEFAGVVSHDLRNPLNVAQGNLALHAEECPIETDAETGSIERVRWSLERMDDLIEDLLSLARHGRTVGDPEPVDLARLVREAWEAVDTTGASLECSTAITVDADEGRVRALFENLFRNAVEHGSTSPRSQAPEDAVEHGSTSPASQPQQDAMEHGSTNSRLQAHESDRKRDRCDLTVTVGRLENGSTSGFYVADDGVGLETATDEIFEFGHTTVDDGTGLGLAIVDGIAEAHGWTVSACESDRGGARFDIRGVTVLEEPAVEQ